MAFQCRSVPLMLFFLTRLRRRLHFFDIWPCKFTPATLFRIYIHLSPPPHPLLCLNPPHPTPFIFSFRICKWLQTVRAMLMYCHKKRQYKGNSDIRARSPLFFTFSKQMRQSNRSLQAAQSAAKVTELHQIIHRHRKFQFASLCIVPFRKSQVVTNLRGVLVHHGWVWWFWKPLRWFARFIIKVSGSSSKNSWADRSRKGKARWQLVSLKRFNGRFMLNEI